MRIWSPESLEIAINQLKICAEKVLRRIPAMLYTLSTLMIKTGYFIDLVIGFWLLGALYLDVDVIFQVNRRFSFSAALKRRDEREQRVKARKESLQKGWNIEKDKDREKIHYRNTERKQEERYLSIYLYFNTLCYQFLYSNCKRCGIFK